MEKKAFTEGKIKLFARMMSKSEMKDFISKLSEKQRSELSFAYECVNEFDVICYKKKYRISLIREYMKAHTDWKIQELASLCRVNRRTIARYLDELRGDGVEVITVTDTQKIKKLHDIERVRKLMARDPSHSKNDLARMLGISVTTVDRLIKEAK